MWHDDRLILRGTCLGSLFFKERDKMNDLTDAHAVRLTTRKINQRNIKRRKYLKKPLLIK